MVVKADILGPSALVQCTLMSSITRKLHIMSLYAVFLFVCSEYPVVCMCLQIRFLHSGSGAII